MIVIGVSSSLISLDDIRQFAENDLKRELIKLPGVANVDVFGGYSKEVQIIVDKARLGGLRAWHRWAVLASLKKNDKDYAIGFVTNRGSRYLLKSSGKEETVEGLRALRLSPDVRLGDVARIYFGHDENTSAYYGNGRKAIALSVQRGGDADVVKTVDTVEKAGRDPSPISESAF